MQILSEQQRLPIRQSAPGGAAAKQGRGMGPVPADRAASKHRLHSSGGRCATLLLTALSKSGYRTASLYGTWSCTMQVATS